MIPASYAKCLTQLGYNLVDPYDTNLKKIFYNNLWVKDIVVSNINIRLGVFFWNWDFIKPPLIYLFEDDLLSINKKIKHFRFPLPHFLIESQFKYLNKKAYNFCYALHDKVEINRNNFSQTIFFLEKQFENVISDLMNPTSFMQELKNEIVPMWMLFSNEFENRYKLKNLFVDLDSKKGLQSAFLTYISNEDNKIQKKVEYDFIVLHSEKINIPLLSNYFDNEGGITLGKMFLLINSISQLIFKDLKVNLKKIKKDKKIFISLLIDNHLVSFFVNWKVIYNKFLYSNVKIISEILRDEVLPVYLKNYNVNELVNRNINEIKKRNLSSLKILQVGAGAIGGYVADALIKIGAGLDGGDFKIFDNDDLKVENIGRHILGKKYIGLNKANAIVEYMKEQWGDNNLLIHSVDKSVNTIGDFDEYDLIIDATGQIEIAEYLNEKVTRIPKYNRPHILHLWIYGNGECVQALINTPSEYESNGGCISCLHQSGVDDYKGELDPLGNKDFRKIMGLGPCAAYTPYSVSSSLAVAGLAIDLLLEWRNSTKLVSNYFTRYGTGYTGRKINDMKLVAQKTCPQCFEKLQNEIPIEASNDSSTA